METPYRSECTCKCHDDTFKIDPRLVAQHNTSCCIPDPTGNSDPLEEAELKAGMEMYNQGAE